MAYSVIQPPFTLQFDKMSKEELEDYRKWFQQVTPERIAEVTSAVKSTSGYEEWEPNLTPASLDALGRWFEHQVETRKKTAQEIEEIKANLQFPIDISDEQLSNRTFSLAMDIGMYFGQVVLENLPGTNWDQPLKSKRLADYGQPVIVGFAAGPLNPVAILVTTAYKISRKKPASLGELYNAWAKMCTVRPPGTNLQ